jgi:hypothetical protein
MSALASRRPALLDPTAAPFSEHLHVCREDIRFHDHVPGRVQIEVTICNRDEAPSGPTFALLQAAPLGAFVPWRPLNVLPVPALGPGESVTLRTEAPRTRTKPLGPPDRVPPRQLLTALSQNDDDRNSRSLAHDLFDLLGRSQPHWAGNFNVFVGTKAVERHLAQALRVYPGRVNLAMFVVGSVGDAYAFRLHDTGADWEPELHNMTGRKSLLSLDAEPALDSECWVELPGQALLILALRPPAGCGQGTVEVEVTQRSTGQTAVVEFSLDPQAAGPGCYVV